MRAELAAARRRAVVRAAARDWARAGLLPDGGEARIGELYPDDRVSKPLVWRVLIFVFTCVILSALFALAGATLNFVRDGVTTLCLLYGAALAAATEIQQGRLRYDGVGSESASSYLSVTFLIAASLNVFDRVEPVRIRAALLLLLAAGILFAAWRRWGYSVYALGGTAALFFAASSISPLPRIAWLLLAAVLTALAIRFQDRGTLAPEERAGIRCALAAALAAGYAALNLFSLDHGLIEALRPGIAAPKLAFPAARTLAAIATAILPFASIGVGLRSRRRLPLDLGIVFGALSLVTLRAYVRLGPLWLVLTEAGAGLALVALSAERFLARGPGRERSGVTAEPLFEDAGRLQVATAAAVLATVSPGTKVSDSRPFSGEGGGFGGGGASDEL